MSEVKSKTPSFLQLYAAGRVTAEQIDDFIDAWHESDDSEHRSLAEFLGMSEDEYSVWLASHKALPLLVAARRDGTLLTRVVQRYVAELESEASPSDATAIHILSHWLAERAAT